MSPQKKILLWLPSPMGDAIMCTPAIRAIQSHFGEPNVWLYASRIVKEVLSGTGPEQNWIEQNGSGVLGTSKALKAHRFDTAALFKNSWASAMTVYLAGIPERVGYCREFRGMLLNRKLYPVKLENREFKPLPMVDYYGAIAAKLGATVSETLPFLQVTSSDEQKAKSILPQVFSASGPVVILVPGGAFGPSKCWPAEYFAQLADVLIEEYRATVVVSVAPNEFEKRIAAQITSKSKNQLINLAQSPLKLGELKALISKADLVVTNDTGPRHMAVALKRKVITMFGPNNHKWTDTGYAGEVQIVSDAPCVPCDKPVCRYRKYTESLCMESIAVGQVFEKARQMLGPGVGK